MIAVRCPLHGTGLTFRRESAEIFGEEGRTCALQPPAPRHRFFEPAVVGCSCMWSTEAGALDLMRLCFRKECTARPYPVAFLPLSAASCFQMQVKSLLRIFLYWRYGNWNLICKAHGKTALWNPRRDGNAEEAENLLSHPRSRYRDQQ